MSKTSIEWTEQTWNPIVGCSIVSPGCTNCYAMKMAGRIEKMNRTGGSNSNYVNPYDGTTKRVNGNTVWTGKLARAPESTLLAPLHRKKPTTYFVNSMGDLFHEDCPDEWIDRVFAVMALSPQHTFQILTKRAARMREYCDRWVAQADLPHVGLGYSGASIMVDWPLPNVWLGVLTERQQEADERIPLLLQTPAAVRFISAEPLLGPLALHALNLHTDRPSNALRGVQCVPDDSAAGFHNEAGPKIDWVIVGAESGPGARPMNLDWARSLLVACEYADVAFFMKQISGRNGRAVKDMADFPEMLRMRAMPEASVTT
jgi:protein gp37